MSLEDFSKGNPFTHPRDEIVRIMSRMYNRGLTTMSGGNVSIKDSEGTIWITPGSTDKGDLKREEVVFRQKDSDVWEGDFKPSREWPFHTKILEKRPDCNAVLHAHSQTLVAYSVANQVPDTLVSYQAYHLCGKAAMSEYRMPGAAELAVVICEKIADHDCVIMENHGVVVCGGSLAECYQKFEALEFCARAIVKANLLGGNRLLLSQEEIKSENKLRKSEWTEWEFSLSHRPAITQQECELRAQLVKFTKRAYSQGLIITAIGAFSARLSSHKFLITPNRLDRSEMCLEDILLVDTKYTPARVYGKIGLQPSREWKLHGEIYNTLPEVNSVILAMPFHFGAFCMTDLDFPTDVHPETYLVCRDIGRISFQESQCYSSVADYFGQGRHALIMNNKGVLLTGQSVQHTYDMLEICESTTNVILDAKALNGFSVMKKEQVEELERHYFGADECKEEEKKTNTRKSFRKSLILDGHALSLFDDEDDTDLTHTAAIRGSIIRKNQSLFLFGQKSGHAPRHYLTQESGHTPRCSYLSTDEELSDDE